VFTYCCGFRSCAVNCRGGRCVETNLAQVAFEPGRSDGFEFMKNFYFRTELSPVARKEKRSAFFRKNSNRTICPFTDSSDLPLHVIS
jgi:hypothetical protein